MVCTFNISKTKWVEVKEFGGELYLNIRVWKGKVPTIYGVNLKEGEYRKIEELDAQIREGFELLSANPTCKIAPISICKNKGLQIKQINDVIFVDLRKLEKGKFVENGISLNIEQYNKFYGLQPLIREGLAALAKENDTDPPASAWMVDECGYDADGDTDSEDEGAPYLAKYRKRRA